MLNTLLQTLPTINRQAGATKAAPIDIRRGAKNHRFLISVTADITIVGAGGGTVRPEGLSNLIQELRVLENGKQVVQVGGAMLGYLTGRALRSAPVIGALASAAAQANTILRGFYVLDFASVFHAIPTETAYVERDSRFPTQIEVQWAPNPEGVLITGTGLTLNSLSVEVVQVFDPNSKVMPFFLPRIKRSASNPITGTQSLFPAFVYPEGQNRVESHIFHSLADGFTSDDVLTGRVSIRGDKERYVDQVDFRAILQAYRVERQNPTARAGYLEFLYRRYGLLSECYWPGQDNNLRLEADVQLPGGATAAVFDIYSLELEPVPGYTRDLPQGW